MRSFHTIGFFMPLEHLWSNLQLIEMTPINFISYVYDTKVTEQCLKKEKHMKKKPTILVVGKEDPSLYDLREKYDLIFRDTDYSTSPFAQAKAMLTSLEDTQLDGVVGFHDKDSPVAAIIAQKYHLVGPPLYAVYLGHNKAMFAQHMKQEQLPYPDTTIINITSTAFPPFDYPIFIKPSKGRLSAFAFMFHSQQEFEEKLAWLNQQPRDKMYKVFEDFFLH